MQKRACFRSQVMCCCSLSVVGVLWPVQVLGGFLCAQQLHPLVERHQLGLT